jgi:CDP-diacylglycerol--glycerol-3-phosphate 3-phosphatidyltransferase
MFNKANQLTLLRIFAVPFIVLLLYFPNRLTCLLATIVFIIASVTDFLDGFFARRYNLISNLGKFLDPLADKLLIMSALVMLTYLRWVPAWITILIIGREITVTGLRGIAAEKGIVISADKYGKLKTIFQIIAICPLILHYPIKGFNSIFWGGILIYIALALTLFSGLNYIYKFLKEVS